MLPTVASVARSHMREAAVLPTVASVARSYSNLKAQTGFLAPFPEQEPHA
jgi:hypothetical protein